MRTRIMTSVAAVLFLIAQAYSAAQGQALSTVLERLNGINARLAALEEAQVKDAKPAGEAPVAVDGGQVVDTAVQHGMAILQMRIDALSASLARFEADLRPMASERKAADGPMLAVAAAEPKVPDAPTVVVNAAPGPPAVRQDSLPVAPQQLFLKVKYPVTFYGYIKLDGSFDGARTSAGNYMRWVDTTGHGDGQFNITARQTRLGFTFGGPKIARSEAGGKLEIDFYGGGEENKNLPLLRQAYMMVAWPVSDFSVIAGQTNDVVSPLNPATLNYVVAWWAGNMGYRRPQFRLTKGFGLGHTVGLRFELAAARSIGGENSGLPSAQGRAALSFPFLAGKKTIIGIYGHTGKEENDSHTWSAGTDLSLPILSKTTIEGEFWTGENLDAYLGGIGQGLKGTAQNPLGVEARGGWISLSTGPYDGWQFAVGSSIDDPSDKRLVYGDRTQNMSAFGNIRYSLNEAVETGVELSSWQTEYKDMADANSIRFQWSWLYKF